MVNTVVYLSHEGYILDTLPPTIPQYRVCHIRQDDSWIAFQLNSKGVYEKLSGKCDYVTAINACVNRARNINRKHYKFNWRAGSDKLDAATCRTFALDGTPTEHRQMIVWSVAMNKDHTSCVFYGNNLSGVELVYSDTLSGCLLFVKDPKAAIEQRLLEQYRMHFGLGLYRYVADLRESRTTEFICGEALSDVIQRTLNFTHSWVTRAHRIGMRFIQPNGRFTNLITQAGDYDWNVTQLSYLVQLEDGEIAFLIERGLLSAVMTSDDVGKVVREYLKDPEHKLHREYLKTLEPT